LFEEYFKKNFTEVNKQQALVPSKAEVLTNDFGTAPGMLMTHENTTFVSMPGVPFEMKTIVSDHLIPLLQDRFERPYILHKTILTYGEGESDLAARIEDWEDNLPSFIKLAYLPSLGKVRLRLSARGTNKEILEKSISTEVGKLQQLINDVIVGFDDDESLEGVIAKLLTVAEAMAKNAAKLFKTNFAIATTGNAGPTKGNSNVDVGTICIAIATPDKVISEQFLFGNNRERNIAKAMNKSLEMLQNEILTHLKVYK